MSSRPKSSAATRGARLQGPDRVETGGDHCLELTDAVAEGEHAAVGPELDVRVARAHQPLEVDDQLVVAAELPDGLAGQGAASQLTEVFLGHRHGRHDVRTGAGGHVDTLVVDQVRVLEAARAGADRLLASLGCTGVHRDGHPQELRSRAQDIRFVVEPSGAGGIVADAEVAARVGRLDPVRSVGVLATHQLADLSGAVRIADTGSCQREA
jgi:hypothetical protein